mmetsp:Transcript_58579/g.156599  ORF Transcript_58579/g.156599 Transcript_58579/m.156599 type:complete len:261 (-) Transcript_58579:1085-1867(-)
MRCHGASRRLAGFHSSCCVVQASQGPVQVRGLQHHRRRGGRRGAVLCLLPCEAQLGPHLLHFRLVPTLLVRRLDSQLPQLPVLLLQHQQHLLEPLRLLLPAPGPRGLRERGPLGLLGDGGLLEPGFEQGFEVGGLLEGSCALVIHGLQLLLRRRLQIRNGSIIRLPLHQQAVTHRPQLRLQLLLPPGLPVRRRRPGRGAGGGDRYLPTRRASPRSTRSLQPLLQAIHRVPVHEDLLVPHGHLPPEPVHLLQGRVGGLGLL